MKKIRTSLVVLVAIAVLPALTAQSQDMVPDQPSPDDFPIVAHYPPWTCVTPIYVDPRDHWLVGKAAAMLQEDIRRVTGVKPPIITDLSKQPFIPDRHYHRQPRPFATHTTAGPPKHDPLLAERQMGIVYP